MNGAFYIGATGLEVQQRNLDVIAQNVANMNTTAYKRAEMRFVELVNAPARADEARPIARAASEAGSGLAAVGVTRVFAQGELRQTDRAYDVAINGAGFIEVLGPSGQSYLWRGGTLTVGSDGLLATSDGHALKALIDMPQGVTELRIGPDGRVQALLPGDESFTEIGQIDLVTPDDLAALLPAPDGLFRAPDEAALRSAAPGENGQGILVQGSLENSNVDLSAELVGMLLAQRAYGASAQVIQAGDQLMGIANGLRR